MRSFLKLPAQAIEQVIKPMEAQQGAFDELKEESAAAAAELRASCPAQMPENPVALHAMVQAIEAVRPKLAAFYDTLKDEQKARFNAMGQQNAGPPEYLAAGRRPPGPPATNEQ